jgi:histidyl-tRNA synthetase
MKKMPKQYLETASGFLDLGPGEAIVLQSMLDVIRKQYERAGFVPIDTSLVERVQILSAKSEGEIGNQVYGLRLLNPAPDALTDTKDLALRFDHTIPLARFLAANQSKLQFPFRRYAIGPVFRGERPRDGRYRQFTQADIDVVGDGELNILYDAEMVSIIANIFTELAVGPFTIRISNRKILQGFLGFLGLSTDQIKNALIIIDKVEKIGKEKVVDMLLSVGLDNKKGTDLVNLLTKTLSTDAMIALLKKYSLNSIFDEGLAELERVIEGVRQFNVPEDCFCIDISIARGLDYYTSTVYETSLDMHPDLGSIASGGRYEDLSNTFTDRKFPGVGISIGVTRLLQRLIRVNLIDTSSTRLAKVLVTTALDINKFSKTYLKQAYELRSADISTEIYLANKQLGKQMQFANKNGFAVAIITFEENILNKTVIVRNLKTGEQCEVSDSDLVQKVKDILL